MRTFGLKNIFILLVCIVTIVNLSISQQCQAITKKGIQCKRKPQAGELYCFQHMANQSPSVQNKNTSSAKIKPKNNQQVEKIKKDKITVKCKAVTKKGSPCKRSAKNGSKYCWQHFSQSSQ